MSTHLYRDGKHCPSRIQHLLLSDKAIISKLMKPNLQVHGKKKYMKNNIITLLLKATRSQEHQIN
jgi:hypothetical protein